MHEKSRQPGRHNSANVISLSILQPLMTLKSYPVVIEDHQFSLVGAEDERESRVDSDGIGLTAYGA